MKPETRDAVNKLKKLRMLIIEIVAEPIVVKMVRGREEDYRTYTVLLLKEIDEFINKVLKMDVIDH